MPRLQLGEVLLTVSPWLHCLKASGNALVVPNRHLGH